MAHYIIYDHIASPGDDFKTLRVLWEPYTNRISLRFRNGHEAASGIVGTPNEIIRYIDLRRLAGSPWNQQPPQEARARIAALVGESVEDQRETG